MTSNSSPDVSEEQKTSELPERLLHLRWDLDKTYLRTEFDTLRDLYRTFRQNAQDKVVIEGAQALLRALLFPAKPATSPLRRVTFISGSPNQMRKVLMKKLSLDGIEPDVFILKPNLSNLLRGRFRAIRGQVGYKVKALLLSHMTAVEVEEYLFGDDAEQDAFIYSLYADILVGRVDATQLLAILQACKVYRRDIDEIMTYHSKLFNTGDTVRRIFIHLESRSPLERFTPYGSRVVASYNYFQVSLILYEAKVLDIADLHTILSDMIKAGYTAMRLANSLQDILRRGLLSVQTAEQCIEELSSSGQPSTPIDAYLLRQFSATIKDINRSKRTPPPQVDQINYLGLYHAARFRRTRYPLLGSRILD